MRRKLLGGWWFNSQFWQRKGICAGWDDIHCDVRPDGDYCSYGIRLARVKQ